MNTKSHKQQIIQAAIDGLVEGGLIEIAENFRILLERVYDCGYYECRRQLEQQNCRGK